MMMIHLNYILPIYLYYLDVKINGQFQNQINKTTHVCVIPKTMRGEWYFENKGSGQFMKIEDNYIEGIGKCKYMKQDSYSIYENTFVFSHEQLFTCLHILYRTQNVLEFKKSELRDVNIFENALDDICGNLKKIEPITLFAVTPEPVNCRSSLEGVYKFEYRYSSQTGFCKSPTNKIRSCQTPGTYFATQNDRFHMNYTRCDSVIDQIEDDPYATSNKKGNEKLKYANLLYSCLGHWELPDGNLYFAVAKLGEAQPHLMYRCFLTRRDQPLLMTKSRTASCTELRDAREGPEMLRLTQMEFERVMPTCQFPKNFSGVWINTANYDSRIIINSTHIYEENFQNQRLLRKTFYVCKEAMGSYYLTSRLSYSGCQIDFVCWDFQSLVPISTPSHISPYLFNRRYQSTSENSMYHNNVLRYRTSSASIDAQFDQVCSRPNFVQQHVSQSNKPENFGLWKYSILLAETPTPIPCPIQGRYTFSQKSQIGLVDRIIGGITDAPQVRVHCQKNESELRVCSNDPTRLFIDVEKCVSLDAFGKPLGEYDRDDYKLTCIGYWREDSVSYLITYDENDPASRYRCWVYTRLGFNKFTLSRSMQSYCGVDHSPMSWKPNDGASLLLTLTESERQYDYCPMQFNPGDEPYNFGENTVLLLNDAQKLRNRKSFYITMMIFITFYCPFAFQFL